MAWFLGQSLLFVGLAFLLGLLVGWLIWGRRPRPAGEQLVRTVVAEQPTPESVPQSMPANTITEPEPVTESNTLSEPEPITRSQAVTDPEPATDPEPLVAVDNPGTAGKPATADNLQRIEGIGPKISTVLIAAEITTFADLAATDLETLTGVLRRGGVRFAPSMSSWPTQADLLANGDEAGFRTLTSQLVAGRRAR